MKSLWQPSTREHTLDWYTRQLESCQLHKTVLKNKGFFLNLETNCVLTCNTMFSSVQHRLLQELQLVHWSCQPSLNQKLWRPSNQSGLPGNGSFHDAVTMLGRMITIGNPFPSDCSALSASALKTSQWFRDISKKTYFCEGVCVWSVAYHNFSYFRTIQLFALYPFTTFRHTLRVAWWWINNFINISSIAVAVGCWYVNKTLKIIVYYTYSFWISSLPRAFSSFWQDWPWPKLLLHSWPQI